MDSELDRVNSPVSAASEPIRADDFTESAFPILMDLATDIPALMIADSDTLRDEPHAVCPATIRLEPHRVSDWTLQPPDAPMAPVTLTPDASFAEPSTDTELPSRVNDASDNELLRMSESLTDREESTRARPLTRRVDPVAKLRLVDTPPPATHQSPALREPFAMTL